MATHTAAKKQASQTPYSKILNTVPYDQGFCFCIAGNYTGVTATSLVEFAEKLKTIDLNSIKFHLQRNDFQKWIKEVLCDDELAEKINQIKTEQLSGENLREELLQTINSRITHLKTYH